MMKLILLLALILTNLNYVFAASAITYSDWSKSSFTYRVQNETSGWDDSKTVTLDVTQHYADWPEHQVPVPLTIGRVAVLESSNSSLTNAQGLITLELFGGAKNYKDINIANNHSNGYINDKGLLVGSRRATLTVDWRGGRGDSSWFGSTEPWHRKYEFIPDGNYKPFIVTLDIVPKTGSFLYGWEREVITLDDTAVGKEACFSSRFLNELGGDVSVRKVSGAGKVWLKTDAQTYDLSSGGEVSGLFKNNTNDYEMCVLSDRSGSENYSITAEMVLN
ncbi:hypothetical protein [Salmonella enterica]|uniref:hypothetical protein n=1 Tax=Salmonella enterica TaxID=28901 RepID=UPI0009A9CEB2|nr:hypothetical protein [Salmonella enterica]